MKLAGRRSHPFSSLFSVISPYRREYLLGLVCLFIVDAINVGLPLVVRQAVDSVTLKNASPLVGLAVLYLSLMVLQAVGRFLWRMYLMGSSHKIARDLRLRFYGRLLTVPLSTFQKWKTGDFMSRATNDIESVRMALGPGVLVAADAVLIFLLITPLMIWLSPKLTLMAFAFYPLVPWMTAKLGVRIDASFGKLQERLSAISSFSQEVFTGIRWIKSLVLGDTVNRSFTRLSAAYCNDGVALAKYEATFSPVLGLLTELGTVLILLVGAQDVLAGRVSLGTYIAFQRFVVQLSWPMEAIGWAVTMLREGRAAHGRIEEVMELGAKVTPNPPVTLTSEGVVSNASTELFIERMQFGFDPGDTFLDLENLRVPWGAKIGIVGTVGSGKTTFFHVLLRMYDGAVESVSWGGRNLRDIPLSELRAKLGAVEQEVFLFSESLEENLRLGTKEPFHEGRARVAIETASFSKELAQLPEGIRSVLGEKGITLSGGQRQRVGLARALYRNPEVLLLDDSFSAVDVQVEKQIFDALMKHYPKMVLFLASHRLSLMPLMDEVWVFSKGRIVAKGKHDLLLNSSDLYQRLWHERHQKQTSPAISAEMDERIS